MEDRLGFARAPTSSTSRSGRTTATGSLSPSRSLPSTATFANRYPNLIGSEYLGDRAPLGQADERGIRNEDFTQLTFPDGCFDAVLSFDCFGHFPEVEAAMRECARVLRPGGMLMWSVPFVSDQYANIVRARITGHAIEHLLPPEDYGDPINDLGCLCFTHFGWEMLDQVRGSGFSDAYAVAYTHEVD